MGQHCCTSDGNSLEVPVEKFQKGKIHAVDIDSVGAYAGGFPPDSVVEVTVVAAHNLDHRSWKASQGPNNPYVRFEIQGKANTKVVSPTSSDSSRNPTWNFTAMMPSYAFPDTVSFTVCDKDFCRPEEHLGKAQLTGSRLQAGNGLFEGALVLGGVEDVNSIPVLEVKVRAVPRPPKEGARESKEQVDELPKGRRLRLGISKQGKNSFGLLLCSWFSEAGAREVLIGEIINGGAVAEYNRNARVQDQLQVGDLILEANGLTKEPQIVNELSRADDVELLVETRAWIFKVSLEKPLHAKLGLELRFTDQGETMVVSSLAEEGAVQAYNETVDAVKQVRVGDHIMSVNGVQDPASRMRELQKASPFLELLVRRVFGLPENAMEVPLTTGRAREVSAPRPGLPVSSSSSSAGKASGNEPLPRIVIVNSTPDV